MSSFEALTLAHVSRMPAWILEELALDDTEDDAELSTLLADQNYTLINLNGLVLIHGFPGDNPMGVLTTPDYKVYLATLGEHSEVYATHQSDVQMVVEWYNQTTNNSCNYDHMCFRSHLKS